MELIQVRNVKKSLGERDILKDVSFDIWNGEKIGLVGWNGSGKTTLIKLIIGELALDGGTVVKRPESLRVGYLPQSTEYDLTTSFMENGNELLETASKLGLERIRDWEEQRLGSLSGGERLKLALAGIWSQNPELLILDEPTNHLDQSGLEWLIASLNKAKQAALIISHDRYFLDETVNKILEIEDGILTAYEGNFTAYRQEKQRRREQQERDYQKQQKKIEMINQQIETFKKWSEKGHREAGKGKTPAENRQAGFKEYGRVQAKKKDIQIRSKLKRLNLELEKHKVERPKEDLNVEFNFETNRSRGKRLLEAKGLAKAFEERKLFEKSHFYIRHGEKIALLGPNGAGKTTFIKMLLGEEPVTRGSLWKSESLKIAYLSQDVNDLPEKKTPLQFLDLEKWEEIARARTLFANMGMKEEKLVNPISALSLGERTRVKLVHMIMQEYDVLILDKPTNHLDLPSREQMEQTLESFSGTLIIVSHDRYFVERLCDKILLIENNRIQRYEMSLKEFLDKKYNHVNLDERNRQEALAVLDTKIAELLGKISLIPKDSVEYMQVDLQLNELIQKKRSY
ncbi:ABC transporter ATP-binding protein [Bacillus sp. FJAT-27225]|uniref:ribosomal protection-like ABC-F family protein n=1 Tax=Bacillus sp. FJAT-27225 TaxID=1743144 RepID=UPI00080C2E02|nr:ABC-F type ribosomal protection protein [Bacillus sp. FJAT-27225]OCA82289.1 ABC transporter ATP-binding protein [Bacillus sp. FJAT-27225]